MANRRVDREGHSSGQGLTFDQLLRVIPNTEEDEAQLISLMKANNIKPDVSFCNQVVPEPKDLFQT